MHKHLALGLGFVLLVAGSACERLTATVQAVSMVTATPNLETAVGMDPALISALPLANLDTNATALLVGVGTKSGIDDTNPAPLTGATVAVAFSGKTAEACAVTSPAGTYRATSVALDPCVAADLAYTPAVTYTTQIDASGEHYELSVEAPAAIAASSITLAPALGTAQTFHGASLQRHAKNTALNLDWSGDPTAGDNNTFVTVLRLNYVGTGGADATQSASWQADAQNPVFDNLPKTPSEMVQLVLGSPATSVDVEATVFSKAGLYFVVLTTSALDIDSASSNLALGSGAMAGVGTAVVFWVD